MVVLVGFVRLVSALVCGILSWCFLRLNLGELGLIVGVCGLFGCVVYGERFGSMCLCQ